jgi:hypothetical protein
LDARIRKEWSEKQNYSFIYPQLTALKSESICSLADILYNDKEALEKHLSSAKKELQTLVQELDAKALCAILRIDEPSTFEIGEDSLSSEILEKITKHKVNEVLGNKHAYIVG